MAVNVPPCTSVCEKQLTCGRHTCTDNCHHGELRMRIRFFISSSIRAQTRLKLKMNHKLIHKQSIIIAGAENLQFGLNIWQSILLRVKNMLFRGV